LGIHRTKLVEFPASLEDQVPTINDQAPVDRFRGKTL
jgi:hypothetical protein